MRTSACAGDKMSAHSMVARKMAFMTAGRIMRGSFHLDDRMK
jgi:hypothetical protein